MTTRTTLWCANGLAVAALVLWGCAGAMKARTDYDAHVDFSRFATYDWLEPPVTEKPADATATEGFDPFADNSLVDKRVREAVDHRLSSRGYQRSQDGSPDFLVKCRVVVDGDTSDKPSSSRRTNRYQRGTLFLDVIDAQTQRIAWRGWTADRNPDGYYTREQLSESVKEVLASFPPKGAKPPNQEEQLRRRVQDLEKQLQEQQTPAAPADDVPPPKVSKADGLTDPVW